MKSKLKLNNYSRDNNSLNTLSFSPKNKALNPNSDRNGQKAIYNFSRKAKNKEFINNKQNNDFYRINNEKNTHLKMNNFNNANLSPLNYAKSLNLLINNKVQAKNTQFINFYNKNKIIKKNNNEFLGNNNKYKYNANFPKNEEKKLKENPQHILRNKRVTQNTFIEERKLYEKEIEELKNENKIMKEKNIEYQKNEEEYKNLKEENEKLNNLNNDINKEKEKLLLELKSKDEEFQKLLKEKNNFNFDISKPVEINIYHERNKVNLDLNKNEGGAKEINFNNNNENNSNNNNVKENNNYKLTREKCLKNILNSKENKIKGYIQKCFGKFYYNGIFLQMTGKLNHISKKKEIENKEKDENNIELNFDNIPETSEIIIESQDNNKNEKKPVQELSEKNNNETKITLELPDNNKNEISKKDQPAKKVTFKEELVENENPSKVSENKEKANNEDNKDKNALQERLKKSRGLRKLMNKKAHEKQEMLRHYFYKFYRQGIYSQFRRAQRRRSVELKAPLNLDIAGILGKKEPKKEDDPLTKLKQKQDKEKEELKQKVVKLLKRIFYKTDRRNMVILSKKFKRFYLIARFETLKNMISVNKVHKLRKKKRKKSQKKSHSVIYEVNKEEIENSENDKNENEQNE